MYLSGFSWSSQTLPACLKPCLSHRCKSKRLWRFSTHHTYYCHTDWKMNILPDMGHFTNAYVSNMCTYISENMLTLDQIVALTVFWGSEHWFGPIAGDPSQNLGLLDLDTGNIVHISGVRARISAYFWLIFAAPDSLDNSNLRASAPNSRRQNISHTQNSNSFCI